jgi:hypothetical protein
MAKIAICLNHGVDGEDSVSQAARLLKYARVHQHEVVTIAEVKHLLTEDLWQKQNCGFDYLVVISARTLANTICHLHAVLRSLFEHNVGLILIDDDWTCVGQECRAILSGAKTLTPSGAPQPKISWPTCIVTKPTQFFFKDMVVKKD